MLLSLISPKAAVAMVARQAGIPAEAMSSFLARVELATAALIGEKTSIAEVAHGALSGKVDAAKRLYETVLADKASWPFVAKAAAEWLKHNDHDGVAIKAMATVSELPLKYVGGDFDSVESFLESGVFPLLEEKLGREPSCCSVPMMKVVEGVYFCGECHQHKDV